jgi:hypothetical protein
MRHHTVQTASNRGVDFGGVQQLGDHSSADTTRRSYVPHELAQSAAATAKIDGRFDGTIFAPRAPKQWDDKATALAAVRRPTPAKVASKRVLAFAKTADGAGA